MGGLTNISLGALIVFHLVFGLGNLLKVKNETLKDFFLFEPKLPRWVRLTTLQQTWSEKEPRELERLPLKSYLRASLPVGKSYVFWNYAPFHSFIVHLLIERFNIWIYMTNISKQSSSQVPIIYQHLRSSVAHIKCCNFQTHMYNVYRQQCLHQLVWCIWNQHSCNKGKQSWSHCWPSIGRVYTRYLSSIAAVLLTLKLGSVHSQRAALLCPLLYHAIVALCKYFSFFPMPSP